MKKKNIVMIALFIVLFSSNTQAGIIGGKGSGIGKVVKIVKKIADQQLKMQIEQAQQGIQLAQQLQNQVQQIQNQMQSLQNEALNLKQLGKDITSGNLRTMNNAFDRILSLQSDAKSLFYQVEGFEKNFETIYSSDLELHGWLKGDVIAGQKKIKEQMDKVREQSRNAIYDAARSADYSAKTNADKRNIQTILQSSSSAEGALQAIQAGNNMLAAINTNISEMKDVLSSQIKLASTVQSEVNQVTAVDEASKEESKAEYETDQAARNKNLEEELENMEEIDITKWGK